MNSWGDVIHLALELMILGGLLVTASALMSTKATYRKAADNWDVTAAALRSATAEWERTAAALERAQPADGVDNGRYPGRYYGPHPSRPGG